MVDFSAIAAALSDTDDQAPLPVEKWAPTHCGEMDLVIRADGQWIHEGTPIGRAPLVRLLSRVLRHDPDGYVLVTPVEKIAIRVEDVPFLIVDHTQEHGTLRVRTNVGDQVTVGADHPIEVRSAPGGEQVPYVLIRGDLWARFARPAYYRLVEGATVDAQNRLMVESDGECFVLGHTA